MDRLFKSSLSGASARHAVVEESLGSAWLYMTEPYGQQPIAGCFLYNTGEAWTESKEAPPPLDPAYASDYRVNLPVHEEDVEIIWSPSGDAVAVRIHGHFVGFIAANDDRGFSRSVREECDWAHPFDVDLFQRLFGAA